MFILRLSVAACILLALSSRSAAADPEPRVRSSHARLHRLLAEGHHRSATFRRLVDHLQTSDVIVHVEPAPPGHPIDGGLQFVGSTPLGRYLRITVRTDLRNSDLVGLLGHELRHAVEVASNPGVRDQASFRRFYEGIGQPSHRGGTTTYDTRAAVEAGVQVALELRLTASSMSRAQAR